MNYRIICSLLAIAMLLGCSQTGYYLQAAKGQLDILSKREPVLKIIQNPATSEPLRRQLKLARDIRRFAIAEMDIEGDPGFNQYADIGRPHVSWNVVAAPQYSIDPKTWCFPIAGCVAYKGYFNESAAQREQQKLINHGYDTLVYGVAAYSTLGWFDDPLLSTYINYQEADLAALLFHEISHQIVYVQDDSEFNEAFATAVEIDLLGRWLNQRGQPEQVALNTETRNKQDQITELILNIRNRLDTAYKGLNPESDKQKLFAELKEAYSTIQQQGSGTAYYDWWFSRPLNNADLLTVSTYFRLVPAFRAMIKYHEGDLSLFFDQIKSLSKRRKTERDQTINSFLEDS